MRLPDDFTVLDVETTVQMVEGKDDPSPYHPANRLVSVGYIKGIRSEEQENYLCLYHQEEPPTPHAKEIIQDCLDNTLCLIGHNIKFDLSWLLECGFHYDGHVWDTMVVEYVLSRGVKRPLDLDSTLLRYGLAGKDHTIQDYTSQGIWFDKMPWSVVKSYGLQDIRQTKGLFWKQLDQLGISAREVLTSEIKL